MSLIGEYIETKNGKKFYVIDKIKVASLMYNSNETKYLVRCIKTNNVYVKSPDDIYKITNK